jgi:plasmid stabilization system protein ParE
VTDYRLISEPPADADVEAAFEWYENERQGLGLEFLDELRAAYNRIADGPHKYQELRGGIRRAFSSVFRMQSTSPSKATSLSSLQCCMLVAIQQSGSVAEANVQRTRGKDARR